MTASTQVVKASQLICKFRIADKPIVNSLKKRFEDLRG